MPQGGWTETFDAELVSPPQLWRLLYSSSGAELLPWVRQVQRRQLLVQRVELVHERKVIIGLST